MVDVIRTHHRTGEFLEDIAVFVCGFCRAECRETGPMERKPCGDEIERLVPAHGLQWPATLPSHERRRQPVWRMHEAKAEAPLTQSIPALDLFSGTSST